VLGLRTVVSMGRIVRQFSSGSLRSEIGTACDDLLHGETAARRAHGSGSLFHRSTGPEDVRDRRWHSQRQAVHAERKAASKSSK
jgi:hypothetical protein